MQYTADEINKRFERASKQTQDVLSSPQTSDKLVTIGETHALNEEQIEDLIDEVGLLLLGFTPINWLEQNLTQRLLLSQSQGRALAKDIQEEILTGLPLAPQNITTNQGQSSNIWTVTESDKNFGKKIREYLKRNPQQKLRDVILDQSKENADVSLANAQEHFQSLPKDIQQAITSPHFEGNLEYIRNKNALLIDKAAPLQNEALLLIMNLSDIEDFPHTLTESLKIHPEEAGLIVRDILSRTIEPIRNSLIAYSRIRAGDEAEANKIAVPTKIESVSSVGPDVVIKTSSRVALDEGLQGFRDTAKAPPPPNLPTAKTPLASTVPPKNENESMPTLMKKLGSTSATPVPPLKPVSSRPLIMPKSAEEAVALTSSIPTPPVSPVKAPEPAKTGLAAESVSIQQKPAAEKPVTLPSSQEQKPKIPVPEVTSALAAEIGNLLKKQPTSVETRSQPINMPSLTPETTPPETKSATQKMPPQAPVFPRPEISSVPAQTKEVPDATISIPKTPPAQVQMPTNALPIKTPPSMPSIPLAQPIAPKMPMRPEDKLGGMMQKPRVEVEMVKNTSPVERPSDGSDPYREPIS